MLIASAQKPLVVLLGDNCALSTSYVLVTRTNLADSNLLLHS